MNIFSIWDKNFIIGAFLIPIDFYVFPWGKEYHSLIGFQCDFNFWFITSQLTIDYQNWAPKTPYSESVTIFKSESESTPVYVKKRSSKYRKLRWNIQVAAQIKYYPQILGSESFARWLVSLALVLALVLEIERYCITASVSHLTCPLPPHQSVIWLAHCHHIISQS